MLVTINTDASFSFTWSRGTFAYWIVCNLGRIKKAGVLRDQVVTPTQAEMKCIVNALYEVSKNEMILERIKKIIINTDSLNAIHVFTNDMEKKLKYKLVGKKYTYISRAYQELKEKKFPQVEIIFAHIKAHEHTDTARNFVNDWCDKSAKEAMYDYKTKQKQLKLQKQNGKPHVNLNRDTAAKHSWRSTNSKHNRAAKKI